MQKAIIFDMDGVICHTNPFHSMAFKSFFAKRNVHSTEDEFVKHMYGKNNSYIMSHFFGRKIEGEELLQLEDEKESLFREIYADKVVPIAGFMEFLASIKVDKLLTGVATSAPLANLELIAGKLDFLDKMESVLASEHVIKHKPDPEVYLKSADNLKVFPKNCLVFEDSFSGVSAALNAGMKVVGVLSSHTKEELPPCNLYIENYLNLDLKKIISLF